MVYKKLLLTIMIMIGLTSLFGCNSKETVNSPQTKVDPPKVDLLQTESSDFYQPSVIVSNQTELDIARTLLEKYLNHYSSNEVSESERLRDYKINEIRIEEKTEDGFIYSAEFSVQGYNPNTPWSAGNGIVKEDGWVEDKFMFITVKQKGNTYTMISWGTSP